MVQNTRSVVAQGTRTVVAQKQPLPALVLVALDDPAVEPQLRRNVLVGHENLELAVLDAVRIERGHAQRGRIQQKWHAERQIRLALNVNGDAAQLLQVEESLETFGELLRQAVAAGDVQVDHVLPLEQVVDVGLGGARARAKVDGVVGVLERNAERLVGSVQEERVDRPLARRNADETLVLVQEYERLVWSGPEIFRLRQNVRMGAGLDDYARVERSDSADAELFVLGGRVDDAERVGKRLICAVDTYDEKFHD